MTTPGHRPGADSPTSASSEDLLATALPWQRLPDAAAAVMRLGVLGGTALFAALATGLAFAPFAAPAWRGWLLPVLAVALVVAAVEALLVIPRRVANYRYAVLPDSIVIRSGALFAHVLVVPWGKVLSIETTQGPLLRRNGLVEVQIGTIAATGHPLGPVPENVAAALRRRLDEQLSAPVTAPAN